jgi:hypothetical protein
MLLELDRDSKKSSSVRHSPHMAGSAKIKQKCQHNHFKDLTSSKNYLLCSTRSTCRANDSKINRPGACCSPQTAAGAKNKAKSSQHNRLKDVASSGSRTRANCLEGNYPTVGPRMLDERFFKISRLCPTSYFGNIFCVVFVRWSLAIVFAYCGSG